MAKGLFIVLDGLDGSGKSEMTYLLRDYLSNKYNVLLTREPTDGKYGKEIREILAKEENPDINAKQMLSLFIKDREDHLKNTIIPFLNNMENKVNIVICDRYYYSTIAFQSAQGLDIKVLIELNRDFLKPDICLIMDIKPEVALERIKGRDKEKFEKLKFMTKLREKFLDMPNLLTDNLKILDASKDKESVFEDIKNEVNNLL